MQKSNLDDWKGALDILKKLNRHSNANGFLLAKAKSLQAQILFDEGEVDPEPKMLLQEAATGFRGHPLESAERQESLAVVVDARGAWSESMKRYDIALRYYSSTRLRLEPCRVRMNRAVTQMFQAQNGLRFARTELNRLAKEFPELADKSANIEQEATRWGQLRGYWRANCAVVEVLYQNLLDADNRNFEDARTILGEAAKTSERWLALSCLESLAVIKSLAGGELEAIDEMSKLIAVFKNELHDAWGEADNRINRGFALLRVNKVRQAIAELNKAYEQSDTAKYPLGKALAAWGLQSAGAATRPHRDDLDFFKARLQKLFPAREPNRVFSPTYVLLLP